MSTYSEDGIDHLDENDGSDPSEGSPAYEPSVGGLSPSRDGLASPISEPDDNSADDRIERGADDVDGDDAAGSADESVSDGADVAREARDRLVRDGLVSGMTYEQAGALAGLSERSVRRLMTDKTFRTEVGSLRAERTARLSDGLSELGGTSLRVLVELMDDEKPGVRIRAVQTVLGMGSRFRREVEMVERIELLERRLDELVGRPVSEEGSDEVS